MIFPLHLRAWNLADFEIMRSGLRWLCADGQTCQPGETIAYCNIGLHPKPHMRGKTTPFAQELRDLQIAITTPIGGKLQRNPQLSKGGFADQLERSFPWANELWIGHIHAEIGEQPDESRLQNNLIMMAGRRMTEIAEIRSGLLTGWHDRSRAWRVSDTGQMGTVLSLGICELDGVIRGERSAFLEILEAAPGAAHIVFVPDTPLVPSVRILYEQLSRTDEEFDRLSRDLTAALSASPVSITPADWIFAGTVLRELRNSPITDSFDVLTAAGLQRTGPADAIILSLSAELSITIKHRKLGYSCAVQTFRLREISAGLMQCLETEFMLVRRSLDDIRADYVRFIELIRQRRPGVQILVYNCMSGSGTDDVHCYAGLDQPLNEHVAHVRNKDLNLMLCDLAREHDIAIIDADAIAADLGGWVHLSGLHQSGALQAEIRKEILGILKARGVPGFFPC